MIPKELNDLLTQYLEGRKTVRDCAEWLASVDWSMLSADNATAARLGRLELLVTEVLEKLRPELDLRDEAADLVNRQRALYPDPYSSVTSSSSSTDRITVSEAGGVVAQRSSSKSPQLEPA